MIYSYFYDICADVKFSFASEYGCPVSAVPPPPTYQPPNCSYENSTGEWYLTPLAYDPSLPSPIGDIYIQQQYSFYINFCQTVSSVSVPFCPEGSSVCQLFSGNSISLGMVSTEEFLPFTR